jgi:hypothetical protein
MRKWENIDLDLIIELLKKNGYFGVRIWPIEEITNIGISAVIGDRIMVGYKYNGNYSSIDYSLSEYMTHLREKKLGILLN